MAISNYSELVTAIQDWMMDRSDLASFAPDFITLGEEVINNGTDEMQPLRVREMETIVSLAPTDGVYTLPTDYLQYRRVVEETSARRPLKYAEPEVIDVLYPSRSAGPSNHFTIIGANLYTFPISANNVELTYYAKVPALTASAATNWLLTKSPGVYLRASLTQAAEFIKLEPEILKQAAMTRSLINGLNKSNMMANYARAGLTLRGITP